MKKLASSFYRHASEKELPEEMLRNLILQDVGKKVSGRSNVNSGRPSLKTTLHESLQVFSVRLEPYSLRVFRNEICFVPF